MRETRRRRRVTQKTDAGRNARSVTIAADVTARSTFGVTVAGEFSNGYNNCGLYLTGVNGTQHYGGDCSLWLDASTWNDTTKAGVRQFVLASMDATQDWFFWTWKIGPAVSGVVQSPLWLYSLGLENGFMPTDPRDSNGACTALDLDANLFVGTFSSRQTGGAGAGTIAPTTLQSFIAWPPAMLSHVNVPATQLPTYTATAMIPRPNMPYPPAETISDDEFEKALDMLGQLLFNLPSALPLKDHGESAFAAFSESPFCLDAKYFTLTESEVATISEMLKKSFGWDARSTGDGIVDITERGPGICSVHRVLSEFCVKYPRDNVLRKWVLDIVAGAEKIYGQFNVQMPSSSERKKSTKRKEPEPEAVNLKADSSKGKPKVQKQSKKDDGPKKMPEAPRRRSSSTIWQKNMCLTPPGTNLKHAISCKYLRETHREAYEDALKHAGDLSLCAALEAAEESSAASATTLSDTTTKRQKLEQSTLNQDRLLEAGKQRKADILEHWQNKVDHVVMRLMCVCGLVPNIIDSDEWKEFCQLLNPQYNPKNASAFAEKIIPREAVFVRDKQVKTLQNCDNLVLTFDGTSIRKPASFYTAHASTPDRRSFFLDGHVGSDERHTADWITEKLLKTIRDIGENKWAATCSDSTNVTKAARRNLVAVVPTMQDLCDCVHHIHNTIGDINKLAEFKPSISMNKAIIKYFSKSTFSTATLRKQDNIETGERVLALKKIGKTRFGTYWTSGVATDQALPNIRHMVETGVIKFKNKKIQAMFLNRKAFHEFEIGLLQYTNIVGPFIRSLWSLEAAHANASDVFVFWLAIAANLQDLFRKGENVTTITPMLARKITHIYNERYAEFFQNEIYFTAFALDPRYPSSDFLKNTISVPNTGSTSSRKAAAPLQDVAVPVRFPRAYERVKDFLKNMLRAMIDRLQTHPAEPVHPVIQDLGPAETVKEFRRQLESFWRNEWPFNQAISDGNSLAWWKSLEQHPQARVLAILAIKIFSMLVNSMPDERTNSHLTWFNSPLRGNQKAETLVDMIQIGQWYGKHAKANVSPKKEPFRPVVKFRNLDENVLKSVQQGGRRDAEGNAALEPDSDSDSDEEAEPESGDDEANQAREAAQSAFTFDIDPDINISAPALLDLVTVTPASASTAPTDRAQRQTVPVAQEKPEEVNWNF
ncbi:ribonuclease H-like domain-containing protein [Mycena sp. CBHHK59/15]|nr:ribonuclease H-like domain-containing protein [Mycena sp. CBHHK59/15]